ncbi:GTP 3',8-cyclase MoaA [Agromyces atrinae]|uniref:GTP 3',8-cyclase n=1 Tax=Agromyces atrinae TaxID=592376 RepID=A0A4V1R1Z3_9MICO|nr:GTP 3',8-cyclase MoaA [Agromyces atrinae]NYD67019.1 cyclic pyranopterin phosphate synthase [Agromyces atrinae]RXZ85248.1 GTP 3',8-cyclase MoaA [Agromyces atrinae]RXZ85356.1 GTP 3',8-cyclase MoaA [Agromyces atrinae]
MTSVPVTIGRRPAAVAAHVAGEPRELVDGFGRVHRDLRISLTDKCSLRCTYCMPAEGVEWLAKSSILSTDDMVRIAHIAADWGITTIRLTGGEPLLRPDVVDIVRRIAAIEGANGPMQVAMTTNGIRLPELMEPLAAAGLHRLNISLDTVRPDRFHELTRRNKFDAVAEGIRAAQKSGLRPLKINAVAMRGVNDDELVDLVEFALEHDAQMRFIEQMPLDAGHTWDRQTMVTQEEILATLRSRFRLTPVPGRGGAPAELWTIDDTPHTVGVIASVTAPFCGACDRLRLTADGQLRNCLFSLGEYDLMPILRAGGGDDELAEMLRLCIANKLPGHGINDPSFLQPDRGMNAIGG